VALKDSLRAFAASRDRMELEHEAFGQKVWIQEMNGQERDDWERAVAKKQDKEGRITDFVGLRAKMIQLTLVDEKGVRVYSENEAEEINQLPGRFREDLFDAALEFNGLTKQAEESQLKNSESEAGNGSGPASPTNSDQPTCGVYLQG
jgi:hypothetical protein